MSESVIAELAAKQAITEVLYRYCRALDRMDRAQALAIWHLGGTADYDGMFEGTGAEFVDWVWRAHEALDYHSHQITNVLIEVDADRAGSESYVTVALRTRAAAGRDAVQLTVQGRYIDRWSQRSGVWAIDHRVYLMDLQTTLPLADGMGAGASPRSKRGPDDGSYGVLK